MNLWKNFKCWIGTHCESVGQGSFKLNNSKLRECLHCGEEFIRR